MSVELPLSKGRAVPVDTVMLRDVPLSIHEPSSKSSRHEPVVMSSVVFWHFGIVCTERRPTVDVIVNQHVSMR